MVRLIKLLLLLILPALIASGLSAQEGYKVKAIKFTGNDNIPGGVLAGQMNTSAVKFFEKLTFWKTKSKFSSFTFEGDMIRLHKYYQRNGFPDPEITYLFETDNNKKKLTITVNIDEGSAVLTDSVNFSFSGSNDPSYILDSLKQSLPLQSGRRFRDEHVFETENIIRNSYHSGGYPFIILERDIIYKEEENLATVNFNLIPGNKSYLGKIIIEGDTLVSRKYINNHIEINEGLQYSPAVLNKTRNDLFRLGLFRFVTVRALTDSVRDNHIPVLIKVMELPRWSFKAGAGYGTEDRIRLSLLMTRLNFMGGGRSLIVNAQHSYFTPFAIETKLIQPDLFFKNMDLIINPYYSKEREDSYTAERTGSAFTLQKTFSKNSAYITYNYGIDEVKLTSESLIDEEVSINEKNNIKSGFTLGFNRNSTNDLFSPVKGWKINSTATVTGPGKRSLYHYFRVTGDVAWLVPVGKSVLAYKLKGGVIQPLRKKESTPIEDRFLLGGAMSLRGWGRHQVSPVNEAGAKTGGNSMLEAGFEWRFPITGIFSAAVFSDIGNAWEKPWEFDLNNLLVNAGTGLRISTPVGPVRLDLATPVFENNFRPQFFITIGHAF
jgi:outer membrane protein insertion porin family